MRLKGFGRFFLLRFEMLDFMVAAFVVEYLPGVEVLQTEEQ